MRQFDMMKLVWHVVHLDIVNKFNEFKVKWGGNKTSHRWFTPRGTAKRLYITP